MKKRILSILFSFALIFSLIMSVQHAQAAEQEYDLNKVRLKIFHLLNFSPAENTLQPAPGSGSKATPTPPPSATSPSSTRIYVPEAGTENVIGSGSYAAATGYKLLITKQLPLKSKTAPTNKYYMWLVKTTVAPALVEQVKSFDESLLPLTDQTFPAKNLTDFNQLVITEESTTAPTSPNLAASILVAIQGPAAAATPTPAATATPIPATPTPSGTGTSSGGLLSGLGDFIRGIFGF